MSNRILSHDLDMSTFFLSLEGMGTKPWDFLKVGWYPKSPHAFRLLKSLWVLATINSRLPYFNSLLTVTSLFSGSCTNSLQNAAEPFFFNWCDDVISLAYNFQCLTIAFRINDTTLTMPWKILSNLSSLTLYSLCPSCTLVVVFLPGMLPLSLSPSLSPHPPHLLWGEKQRISRS